MENPLWKSMATAQKNCQKHFKFLGSTHQQELECRRISKHFKTNDLSAITVPDNLASQKLLKKLGFEFSKTTELKGAELFVYKNHIK